ncbi:hypothetical protein [Nonomuraea rubra]|uniref:hypothetical protein n=1 Tax=Nonomuraea rubra TaxID=46180 RepID=UPI0033DC6731
MAGLPALSAKVETTYAAIRQAAPNAVCSSQSWIHPVLDPTPLHPHANGHRLGYLAGLNAATG